MKQCGREQSLSTAEIESGVTNRQRQLEQLFQTNYGTILDFCLASRQLLIQDADRLIEGLASHLSDFSGETDTQFIQWATEVLTPTVERLSRFYATVAQYKNLIHATIWTALGHHIQPNRFDDDYALEAELFNDTCLKIIEKLDALLEPGTAALSTRIAELTKWRVRAYLTKMQTRKNAVKNRLSMGQGFEDCETLSEAEIDAVRATEKNQEAAT